MEQFSSEGHQHPGGNSGSLNEPDPAVSVVLKTKDVAEGGVTVAFLIQHTSTNPFTNTEFRERCIIKGTEKWLNEKIYVQDDNTFYLLGRRGSLNKSKLSNVGKAIEKLETAKSTVTTPPPTKVDRPFPTIEVLTSNPEQRIGKKDYNSIILLPDFKGLTSDLNNREKTYDTVLLAEGHPVTTTVNLQDKVTIKDYGGRIMHLEGTVQHDLVKEAIKEACGNPRNTGKGSRAPTFGRSGIYNSQNLHGGRNFAMSRSSNSLATIGGGNKNIKQRNGSFGSQRSFTLGKRKTYQNSCSGKKIMRKRQALLQV